MGRVPAGDHHKDAVGHTAPLRKSPIRMPQAFKDAYREHRPKRSVTDSKRIGRPRRRFHTDW